MRNIYIDAMDYVKDVAVRMESITNQEYFLRHDRKTKLLIEEEWPLACLGKILYHPDRRIKILYRGPNNERKPDGEIIVEGRQKQIEGWDDVVPVEITSVPFPKSHLIRKVVGTEGSFVGNAIETDAEIREFIPHVIDNLQKKYYRAEPYPPNAMIVCAIFPERPFARRDWNLLFDEISTQMAEKIKYKTVIIDTFSCQHFIVAP